MSDANAGCDAQALVSQSNWGRSADVACDAADDEGTSTSANKRAGRGAKCCKLVSIRVISFNSNLNGAKAHARPLLDRNDWTRK